MAGKVVTGLSAVAGGVLGSIVGAVVGVEMSSSRFTSSRSAGKGAFVGMLLGTFAGAALTANSDPSTGTGVAGTPKGLGVTPSPHKCTAASAAQIAAQIPRGPWNYMGSAPAGRDDLLPRIKVLSTASSRVEEHDVQTSQGAKRIPVTVVHVEGAPYWILLTCPFTGERFAFQQRAAS